MLDYLRTINKDNDVSLIVKEKNNLPRNHRTPEDLKMFCHAVKSEILDPEKRNKVRPNLPPGELKALKELISLQRNRVITIKPCEGCRNHNPEV